MGVAQCGGSPSVSLGGDWGVRVGSGNCVGGAQQGAVLLLVLPAVSLSAASLPQGFRGGMAGLLGSGWVPMASCRGTGRRRGCGWPVSSSPTP